MIRYIHFFTCLIAGVGPVCGIRVCQTLSDYNWLFNRRCYDNPVVNQHISQIILNWGYTAEEHYLTTEDGYQVLVERAYSRITKQTPLIIVHGIAMNALGWVNRGNNSLAHFLASQGYDVWMLNYRGTWYSKGHTKFTTKDPEYWKFSINDLGVQDVRATVKHVYYKTRQQAIYIGYSMGSTGFFVYSTTFPNETEQYVKGMIGLAPVINYKEAKTVVRYVAPLWSSLKSAVYLFWNGEILPGFSWYLRPLVQFSLGIEIVQGVVNLIFGDDDNQVDYTHYPVLISQLVDTTGAEIFTHYLQIYQAGVFQNYDHGKEENMRIYGNSTPPVYDLSKVPVPVALFVGVNDWVASQANSKQLYSELNETSRCGYSVIPFDKWNHVDFLVAKHTQKYLYDDLFAKIQQIDSGKCAS